MVCQILNHHLDSTKLPYHVKHEVQTNIADVDRANQIEGFKSTNVIDMQLREVKIFNSIMPKQMVEYQKEDSQLSISMTKYLQIQNPGCQKYTILGQSLFTGYYCSLTIYH